MANTITPSLTRTTLQATNTLSGNGSSGAIAGAKAAILSITKATGTAGVYTFEKSHDEGAEWSPLSVVRSSTGASVTATTAAESGESFIVPLIDGDVVVRARISTNWVTSAPSSWDFSKV